MSATKIPNIRLFADRVLIEVIELKDRQTASGLYIPDTANPEDAANYGRVLNISRRVLEDPEAGEKLEVGEVVMYSKYAGTDISVGTDKFKMLRITDIFGVDEDFVN